jgi:hypothetical protein
MGFLSSLAGIAAPIAGTLLGGPAGGAIGGAIGGLLGSSGQPKSTTSTTQQQLDPRIEQILFGGSNGNGPQAGLLSQYQDLLNQPQNAQLGQYGQAAQNYLGTNGAADLGAIRGAANSLIGGNTAVGASLPAYAVGNQIKAPAQNNIDLSSTFGTLLGGGNTDALMKSLQAGNALTNQQLAQSQASLTDNFQKTVLPSIRGGAIAAGQYGSSRQGIAEGNAIQGLTKQLNDQATQVSLANSANNANALAGAYENGQNRALSAAQGLSAQQYATAGQNANTANQAEFMNVGNSFDASKFNASTQNQVNQANAGNAAAGAGLLGGLLGQTYGVGNAQDNYGLTRAQGVNGLLAPYLSANSTTTSTQPLYQNTANNVLGGALGGLQLGGLLGGGGKTSSGATMGGLFDLFGNNSSFGSGFGSV